jgi:hypothetical protein
MKVGMLWFDNDPKKDLTARITEASAYYERKNGVEPSVCAVHPSDMPNPAPDVPGIRLVVGKLVQRNHLMIGVEDVPAADRP